MLGVEGSTAEGFPRARQCLSSVQQRRQHQKMFALRSVTRAPARRALLAHPAHSRSLASKKSNPATPSTPPTPEPTPTTEVAAPAPQAAGLPTLDFSPSDEPHAGADGGRTGAKSSKDSLSSIEQRRQYLSRISFGLMAVALGLYTVTLGSEWTEEELKEKRMVCLINVYIVWNLMWVFRRWRMRRRRGGDEQLLGLMGYSM